MTVGQSTANVVRRLVGRRGRGRASASFGAAALGVLLLAGAVLGNGISRTAVAVSDGLTWLGDDERGEVVQVNPASGRPETRLRVVGGESQLDISQRDGTLVVLDRRTGQITVIDLATLLASGRRQAQPGGTSKVVLAAGRLYVIDRAAGSVANADLVTLVDLGPPWLAGQPLADAVADEDGVLWVVDHGGTLYALEWSDTASRFVERSQRPVHGAGPRTVLVPHKQGVTLLGLEGGVILRDGTDVDLTAATARQSGAVLAAQISPTGLAPASVPEAGKVVLVVGDKVITVDVAALGCAKPGRPAVFRDKVYVPCLGGGQVIVLDNTGGRGDDDVRTEGTGDPQLVFDDGKLFINSPGSENGVVVDQDGEVRPVQVRSPELEVTNPDRSPPPSPPSPPKPDPDEPTRTRPNQPRPPAGPPSSPGNNGGDVENPVSSGSVAPTTTSASREASVPGSPPGVSVSLVSRDATAIAVTVSWGAAVANGSPVTGYTAVASGRFAAGTVTKQVIGTSTQMSFPCAGSQFCQNGRLDVSVTAANAAGSGQAGAATWAVPITPTTTPPTTTNPPLTTNPPPTTNPPVPTTTTTVPPPPPPPPPPPALPAAGATVITAVSGGRTYVRTVSMAPPSGWAGHDGPCELVNKTQGYSEPISCAATSGTINVEEGPNSIVVRAFARGDTSRSVDSAAKPVFFPIRQEPCPDGRACEIPRMEPASNEVSSGPMAGAGVGLLLTALLITLTGRREEQE